MKRTMKRTKTDVLSEHTEKLSAFAEGFCFLPAEISILEKSTVTGNGILIS